MSEYVIQLQHADQVENALLVTTLDDQGCHVRCDFRGISVSGRADDFFEALTAVRQQLEMHGLLPLVWGASRDVYTSPMARDLSHGQLAWRLVPGCKPAKDQLLNIFESGADMQVVSVAEQRACFEHWLASVKD